MVILRASRLSEQPVSVVGHNKKNNNESNNNVHLSCAHQRPERSHDTY